MRADHLAELAEARQVVLDVMRRRHVVVSNGHVVSEIVDVADDGKPVYGEPIEDDGPRLDAARVLTVVQARESALVGGDAAKRVEAQIVGEMRVEVVGVDPSEVA